MLTVPLRPGKPNEAGRAGREKDRRAFRRLHERGEKRFTRPTTEGKTEADMDERALLEQVAETGRLLLASKLVARTWGNFSARLDGTHYAVTPSGLGYERMNADDIVRCSLTDGSWEGSRRPSSEKGIHDAVYRLFPEAGFAIHTHQAYATALGLSAPGELRIRAEEREALGGLAWAEYGLPGTEKLKNAVADALRTGAHTVLMKHHGVLICGVDREETLRRASLLEEVCRRSWRCAEPIPPVQDPAALLSRIRRAFPGADAETGDASRAWSALGVPLRAQLDDAAQMIGGRIPCAKDERALASLLRISPAVFVPGLGAVVCGEDAEDTAALRALTDKAAIAALHTRALGCRAGLGLYDRVRMRQSYRFRYAKRKKG